MELAKLTIHKLKPTDTDLIGQIGVWYLDEWNIPIATTLERLSNQPNEDILFQLVVFKDNKPVATGGVYHNVGILKLYEKFKDLKPWLAQVYTVKEHRNQGIAKLLLSRVDQEAKAIGLHKLYLYTFTAESLYKKLGWKEIDKIDYKGNETAVMEKGIFS